MTRPDNLPRGALTLQQLAQRAGSPQPRYAPLLVDARPSARPGYLDVTVSLSPGERVTVSVTERHYDPGTIAAIIQSAPALYTPAGLKSDLYQSEPEG